MSHSNQPIREVAGLAWYHGNKQATSTDLNRFKQESANHNSAFFKKEKRKNFAVIHFDVN